MSTKTALRRFIQRRNLHTPHSLQDCSLIIDADSFFKDSYKNSGCQFLFGPECDKYAIYLVGQLECFSKCNIKCYVIFKGVKRQDLEKRQKVHQEIIGERYRIEDDPINAEYFDPLLVKDIQKQTLDLMGIKYFCCEYESIEAVVGVARVFKCPVLTNRLEYCLYDVSCIRPDSITWDTRNNAIICTIYDCDKYKVSIGVYNKMPILLTVLSMISVLPKCGNIDDIPSVIQWVKRQHKEKEVEIANQIENVDKRKLFLELFHRNKILYSYPSCHLAVKYFQREKLYGLFKDDKKWFSKGVSNGRIALPYIDMKRKGLVTGSTVVNNVLEHDAIEAAAQMITYAHCLLTNCQKSSLKYIGRNSTTCTTWDTDNCWKGEICNRDIFNKYGKMKKKPSLGNPFQIYIQETLSAIIVSDIKTCFLSNFPEDCILLVITLVYYVHKVNKRFMDGAYYILLCYLVLGPIRHILKTTSPSTDVYRDCKHMYDKIQFLFQYDRFNFKYNTRILHSLAEFLHCLQHMNYLNNLCKQNGDFPNIPATLYNKTYNATFVYNSFTFMKDKNRLMSYLKSNFQASSYPIQLYKIIVSKFEKYLRVANGTLEDTVVDEDTVTKKIPFNFFLNNTHIYDDEDHDNLFLPSYAD